MLYATIPAQDELIPGGGRSMRLVGAAANRRDVRWTIVLVIVDDHASLSAALRWMSLHSQPFKLLLVDTTGADRGAETLREQCAAWSIEVVDSIGSETDESLAKAIDNVDTEFVAICFTDARYPLTYLRNAEQLFDRGGDAVAAACAYGCPEECGFVLALAAGLFQVGLSRLLPRYAYFNAVGRSFRTRALRGSVGYHGCGPQHTLGDRATMRSVLRNGRQVMSLSHWCSPPRRLNGRVDRASDSA